MEENTPQTSAPAQAEYEFTGDQNRVIADLARKMHLVGIVLMIVGVLGALGGLAHANRAGAGSLIQGLLYVFLGFFTMRGADAFQRIVRTQGRDITHLMDGLRSLGSVYAVFYWLIVIALVLLLLWLFVFVLVLAGVGIDRLIH
jgi:hypothetical protein